jgi:uncharacterized UPF0160 family protein
MNKIKQIVTHNGKFHSDELIACAIVRLACGRIIPVIRSREVQGYLDDPNTIVVDVGGTFDSAWGNFDHHQRDAELVRRSNVPYSSAGLVWASIFGRELCQDTSVWEAVDRKMAIIDASDNGVGPAMDELRISLQEILSSFNTTWLEDGGGADTAFETTLAIATQVLRRWIAQAEAAVKATNLVEAACAKDPEILRLPQAMPWHDTFFTAGNRTQQFVIFKGGEGDWRLQCIPPTLEESFKQRTPLPETWAGLRGVDLEAASGVRGAVFCHKGRFIAGSSTQDAVEEMARLALTQ